MIKSQFLILIIILCFSFMVGCGHEWNTDSFTEDPYSYVEVENKSKIQTIVDSATVYCENEEDCSESVALLIGFNGTSAFQCSATYIGHGYFTSNAHCVPTHLVYEAGSFNEDCSGFLWVKFPETSFLDSTTYECEKLSIVTLRDKSYSPEEVKDMTIFKVRGKVNREPLEIDWHSHPEDGDLVTFWPSDPNLMKTGIHGIIRKKTCRVSDKRELSEILDYYQWKYPVSYLNDCSLGIIKGNSGSTGVNENGHGVVLISHSIGWRNNQGLGSNYNCSDRKLENEEIVHNATEGCYWVSNKLKNRLIFKIKSKTEIYRSGLNFPVFQERRIRENSNTMSIKQEEESLFL